MTQYTYELQDNLYVKRISDNGEIAWIPNDPTNSDYQRYLNPEAEQSTPSVTNEAKTK